MPDPDIIAALAILDGPAAGRAPAKPRSQPVFADPDIAAAMAIVDAQESERTTGPSIPGSQMAPYQPTVADLFRRGVDTSSVGRAISSSLGTTLRLTPVGDIASGVEQGAQGLSAALALALGQEDVAREYRRLAERAESDQDFATRGNPVAPEWPARMLRGAARSMATSIPGAVVGGPAGAIASGMAVSGADTYLDRREDGAIVEDALAAALRGAGYEGLPAAIMQRFGLGGMETMLADAFRRGGETAVREILKRGVRSGVHELPEELTATNLDLADQALTTDRQFSAGDIAQANIDTAAQAFLAPNLISATQAARVAHQRSEDEHAARTAIERAAIAAAFHPDNVRAGASADDLADLAQALARTPIESAEVQRWHERVRLAEQGNDRRAVQAARRGAADAARVLEAVNRRMSHDERALAQEVPDAAAPPVAAPVATGPVPGPAPQAPGTPTTPPPAPHQPTDATPAAVTGETARRTGETAPAEAQAWQAFPAFTGSLGIPRATMPQVQSEQRGALANFLRARGIAWTREEADPATLRPTQAEFSPAKVQAARQRAGDGSEQRAILVAQDGYVVDGHHQWLQQVEDGAPRIAVVRLHAPIRDVLEAVRAFPSSTTADGATPDATTPQPREATREPVEQPAVGAARSSDDLPPDATAAPPRADVPAPAAVDPPPGAGPVASAAPAASATAEPTAAAPAAEPTPVGAPDPRRVVMETPRSLSALRALPPAERERIRLAAQTVLAAAKPRSATAGRARTVLELIQRLEAPPPVAAPPAGRIEDIGEKIGGARKDTAEKTGPRAARPKPVDERPAWARPWAVQQIVSSSNPDEVGQWSLVNTKDTDWRGAPKTFGKPFASQAEAESAIPIAAVGLKHRVRSVGDRFGIYRMVSDQKMKLIQGGFATREEAERHMATHARDILERDTSFGEEVLVKPERAMRSGPARRSGNVGPQDFRSTFGFRGVEFGNWNNQAERQDVMNHAFDGLMDLAETLQIPPAAISLNGELALAFGSRGHGLSSARAHYEADRAVINLTKMKGAGALAHEWWHGVDHYFARQEGTAVATMVGDDQTGRRFPLGRQDRYMATDGLRRTGGQMRAELRERFQALVHTITRKSVAYVEDTAKTQEFVRRSRDQLDGTLRRIRSRLMSERAYGARKGAASPEQLGRWDAAAQALLSDMPAPVDWKANPASKSLASRWTNEHLDALEAVFKDVTGRSGRKPEQTGDLDLAARDAKHYQQRVQLLQDAQRGDEKQRVVPTQFLTDAKEIDQGRSTDYWTEPTELAARAFSAFVEDRIAAAGGASQFLSYGSENRFYATMGIRPFPEGAERAAINDAFAAFFGAMRTEQTATGTRLYGQDREPGATLPEGSDPVTPEQVPAGFNPAGRGDPQAQRFVRAPDGGLDWGAIDAEVAAEIGRQAGPIRLQVGWHGGEGEGFGLVHLRAGGKHLARNLDLLQRVLQAPDEIRQVGARLILSRHGDATRPDGAFIELVPGDHYSVITAYGLGRKWEQVDPVWSRSTTRTRAPRPGTPGLPVTANEGQGGPLKAAQQTGTDGSVSDDPATGKRPAPYRPLSGDGHARFRADGMPAIASSEDVEALAPIVLTGTELSTSDSYETLRDAAKRHLASLRSAGPFVNEQTGRDVIVDRQGAKEPLYGFRTVDDLRGLAALPASIERSVYTGTENDEDGKPVLFHYFQAPAMLAGQRRTLTLVIRETDGLRFYDQHYFDKRANPVGAPGRSSSATSPEVADPRSSTGSARSIPGDLPPGKRPQDGRLFGPEQVPGDVPPTPRPDPTQGTEALVAWAIQDRERAIAEARRRVAKGGALVEEHRRTLAEHEAVSAEALADDIRRYPQHYIRLMSDRGGNMAPVGIYRRRQELPPQEPRVQAEPLRPLDGQAPDLQAMLRQLNDDLRRATPAAPVITVDRGALPEGTAGAFDPRTGGIVGKYHNDLDLIAHEVGHWVGVQYGLLPAADDADTRAELARLAVHGSPATGDEAMQEGIAEYLRAWMLHPMEAEQRAPLFAARMRAEVPAPVAEALRNYGDAVRRFLGSTNLEKMAAGQRRTSTAIAEEKREGRWYRPFIRAMQEWWGSGRHEGSPRGGVVPKQWAASTADKARFHITDKEAPQLANYLTTLALTGQDPATMTPSQHWDFLRKSLRGVAGKIRDGVTRFGLPNRDGTVAIDPQTGEPMTIGWLLGPALDLPTEEFGAWLDLAHAYGSAQRTMELAARFTAKAESDIERMTTAAVQEAGAEPWRQRAAAARVQAFAAERRKALRMQLARITAAGGGIESATEVARKAIAEMAADPRRAGVEEYLRRYRAWADWNLQYAVDSDLLSSHQADTIRQANQFYLDWHRVFAQDDGPVNLGEAVTGSSRTTHNPLASLLHATWGTVSRGDRNHTMLAFLAPLRGQPVGGVNQQSLARLGRQISEEAATQAMSAHHGYHDDGAGGKQRVYVVQRVVQEMADDGSPLSGPNGEPLQRSVREYWVFDPATEASMEAMRSEHGDDPWAHFTQGLVNLQRLMITSAPNFRLKVLVRDNLERLLNTEVGSGAVDVVRGNRRHFADPLTGEQVDLERLFSQSGASMAGWNRRTREQIMADMFGYVEDIRAQGYRWMTPSGLVRAWGTFGERTENLARRAEFLAAFRKARVDLGYTQMDAALYAMTHARGLLDTAESGHLVGKLNRYFLFLNAAVKGVERTTKLSRAAAAAYRRGDTAIGNRLATLVAVRMAMWGGSLMALRLMWLGMSDDDEQHALLSAPAWKRDFAIILPDVGLGKIAIPKPYEWGFIGSGFERLADAVWATARADAAERAGRTAEAQRWREHATRSHEGWAGSGVTALLPIKFDDLLGGGLAPVIEVALNRSFFTWGSIIPPHEAERKLELRARADEASLIGRGISAVVAPFVGDRFGDPRAVDHLLRGYLGGWGTTATAKDVGEVVRRFSGYSGETSPYAERDVRWVLDWAAANGQASRKAFASLRAMAKAARDADPADRDRRMETLRRNAAFLRRGIERQEARAAGAGRE